MGRNTTGPPRAPPGELRCICAALQTTDDANRRQRPLLVCPYTMCRRASNKSHDFKAELLPRDAMLARYMLSSCGRPSVRLTQAGTVPKRLNV